MTVAGGFSETIETRGQETTGTLFLIPNKLIKKMNNTYAHIYIRTITSKLDTDFVLTFKFPKLSFTEFIHDEISRRILYFHV